jgi:hypothetical protein
VSHIQPRHHHLGDAASLGLKEARSLAGDCSGINRKTAIIVPAVLGSMPFFWFTIVLACLSLPAVVEGFCTEVLKTGQIFPSTITKAALIALIAWIAQTFIQLVALPVLQVSNNAQMAQQEEHTGAILKGVNLAADRLDVSTEGGLKTVVDEVKALGVSIAELSEKVDVPPPLTPPPTPKPKGRK